MHPDFWLDRWAKHEIGFHQRHINEYLTEHWPHLRIPNAATVFVPLCGKTLDMRWLREQGHDVLGIEISRVACCEFFEEWNVKPEVTTAGPFERWRANGVTLLCGDFFALERADLAQVSAVFDRAALIALPPDLRRSYAIKLRDSLIPHTPILLVATDYDQQQMSGPPFAVGAREIHELFAGCRIDDLASIDVTESPDNARFRQRGLTRLVEAVYRIDAERSASIDIRSRT